ncbi:sensor histidine kinase [Virgibacillus halophilus]|uniref:histidine kinase n=2 Tax=Tigheibacillus halophilus TaxID=361280 RepID=A0ABU5CAY6_9BACI|nr:sensor histidine kinase [Virgibacillus halophilus]
MAFLKDQLSYILFFYSQCALIIITVQLAATIDNHSIGMDTVTYIILLVTVCLAIFLLFRYMKLKEYYQLRKLPYSDELPDPPNKLLAIIRDQQLEQTNQYTEEIEMLKEEKLMEFNFIQQWVHQMKTPVSVLQLILQKEKENMEETLQQNMQEELEKLQQGLELALYQSRLQKFDRDFLVEQVYLQEMVRQSIQEFKSSFIRNQVFPSLEIDKEIIVATDAKWFRFVLNQLISNAIKYSRPESDKIYFTAEQLHGQRRLMIRDTGCGIPSQDIQRVFDPFFTGINGRTFHESTGMGLYLSKEICNALGHELHVSSNVNIGTTVTITFVRGDE